MLSNRGKELFERLTTEQEVRSLIGQSEDVHFDCKEWSQNENDVQKTLAKAACGLTNAEGGVLIIGLRARPLSKDDPDLIESVVPVQDTRAVKSKVLDLIGKLVEPGVEGIVAREINDPPDSKVGFVTVYVPQSVGSPRRSKKDSKFYLRIGSGTFPMEYFQIEERFGRRPPPKLELFFERQSDGPDPRAYGRVARIFALGITNVGSGIAKFPSLRFNFSCGLGISQFGIDRNGGYGLSLRPSEPSCVIFGGGVDEVIYPAQTVKITTLFQSEQSGKGDFNFFPATIFECEISCDGTATIVEKRSIPREDRP